MAVGKDRAKKDKTKKRKKEEYLKLQEEAYQETLKLVATAKLELLRELLDDLEDDTDTISRSQLEYRISVLEGRLMPEIDPALAEVDAVVAEKEAQGGNSPAS